MEKFYATFGTGWGYAGGYVEIIAENRHAATAHMVKEHGERWAAIYTLAEIGPTLKKYAMHKLATVQQRPGAGEVFFDIVKDSPQAAIDGIRALLSPSNPSTDALAADEIKAALAKARNLVDVLFNAARRT